MNVALLQPLGARSIQAARSAWSLASHAAQIGLVFLRFRGAGTRVIRDALVKQLYFTGVQATLLVAVLGFNVGALLLAQTPAVVSDGGRLVGTLMDLVVVRQLGPLLTAFILIARSGTAITVELGNMRVHGEIDTLESLGIEPLRYLVLPRAVGLSFAALGLYVLFVNTALLGALTVAGFAVDAPPQALLRAVGERLTLESLSSGLLKSAVGGFCIAAVTTWQGLSVRRTITDVPRATTRAISYAIAICIWANLIFTLLAGGAT